MPNASRLMSCGNTPLYCCLTNWKSPMRWRILRWKAEVILGGNMRLILSFSQKMHILEGWVWREDKIGLKFHSCIYIRECFPRHRVRFEHSVLTEEEAYDRKGSQGVKNKVSRTRKNYFSEFIKKFLQGWMTCCLSVHTRIFCKSCLQCNTK